MTFSIDPAIAATLAAAAGQSAPRMPARGDALAVRELFGQMLPVLFSQAPQAPDVTTRDIQVTAEDGTALMARWYSLPGDQPGSAAVYAHGGGMICGSVDGFQPVLADYVQSSGVPLLAVDYRLAPEHPGESPVRDTFAGLRWLFEHASELGVDPARIALMGDSAGGGIAAGTAILARQEGVPVARQILIYPMLDDRNTVPDPLLASTATWNYDFNYTGWHALLGDSAGAEGVSPIAAPARLEDFTGLPPAYIEVGVLDIFRDESIDYARRLLAAGIDVELHVIPGAVHAHEWFGYTGELGPRARAARVRVLRSI